MHHETFHYKTEEELRETLRALGLEIPLAKDFRALFQPLGKIPNRIVFQPMEGCDGGTDGSIGDLSLRRYIRSAEGGAGLLWFEAVAIVPEGRANPRQPWLTEKTLPSFQKTVEAVKEAGLKKNGYAPVMILQATHSGRYSRPEGKPAPLIAYNNPLFEKDAPISPDRILSDDALDRLPEYYGKTARLAEEAGFDGVDVKCCHRYLLSELLSAYNRPGRYGGSLENRARLLLAGIDAANASTGSGFLKTSRLNLYDAFPYPWGFGTDLREGSDRRDTGELFALVSRMREKGVRLLNTTMGNPYVNPHVNRPYDRGGYVPAEHPLEGVARMLAGVRELSERFPDMDFVASGMTYLRQYAFAAAAGAVETGGAALAGFGRESFAYPGFPNDLRMGEFDRRKLCVACSKCTELMRAGSVTGCVLQDKEIYLPLYREFCMKK
ncbi:MAG: flavin oxidoreductase/NADH oxidase [Clostridia bacterium]|nr:flavin oxidoreductase/NADH oxidase [Clostridia bacterium]MBR5742887.1 flavin oxidoreductase/NADH oxidase [Clostridia bacterium]